MEIHPDELERCIWRRNLRGILPEIPVVPLESCTLLQEANEIALGIHATQPQTQRPTHLASVFNHFRDRDTAENTACFYQPQALKDGMPVYPQAQKTDTKSFIADLQAKLRSFWQAMDFDCRSLPAIRRQAEIVGSFFPMESNGRYVDDISLYDHAKLTVALAAALLFWQKENQTESLPSRKDEAFLLASGDVSGIQPFIYTIPEKGALKSLRGRSFYLDLLLEHMADEILEALHLPTLALLYAGGGHFYLLLPNTKTVQTKLYCYKEHLNDWFLQHMENRLYLALEWTPATAEEFMGQGEGAGAPFRRVSQRLSQDKLRRYAPQQLASLFDPNSERNRLLHAARECAICHMSTTDLQPYGDAEDGTLACPLCQGLFYLGQKALRQNVVFTVQKKPREKSVPLPSLEAKQDLYLVAQEVSHLKLEDVRRVYIKNQLQATGELANDARIHYLWLADYVTRDEAGQAMELADLAALSGIDEERGIRRLAVLRADVDNLGVAFSAGFPQNFATLSRTAALSRALSLFFKRNLPLLAQGKFPEGETAFSLTPKLHDEIHQRRVHVIYAGGDDLFLVGAWDDLLELALDIRHAFKQFTGDKLTFSAGLGLYGSKYPISALARAAGDLETVAKDNHANGGTKDSLALFGEATEVQRNLPTSQGEAYAWNIFEKKVLGEKLQLLTENLALTVAEAMEFPQRLPIGKGQLYRLRSLLQEARSEKGGMPLARFAYLLARLEPLAKDKQLRGEAYQNLRDKLYRWLQAGEDNRELSTAIELLIYCLRVPKPLADANEGKE